MNTQDKAILVSYENWRIIWDMRNQLHLKTLGDVVDYLIKNQKQEAGKQNEKE